MNRFLGTGREIRCGALLGGMYRVVGEFKDEGYYDRIRRSAYDIRLPSHASHILGRVIGLTMS